MTDLAAPLMKETAMADTKTQKSDADELRAAAAKLRETAKQAAPGPWRLVKFHRKRQPKVLAGVELHRPGRDQRNVGYQRPGEVADAEWTTLAHPGLAEPLAAWLEDTAAMLDHFADLGDKARPLAEHALAVARVLVPARPGGAP